MDFDSIPYGVDFQDQIKRTLERARVVIAVIGPAWLGSRGQASRRIDEPNDFVRFEITYALQRGTPVIPVLVDNTPMPEADNLPKGVEKLALRNALVLDTGVDFHHHVDRLIASIRSLLDPSLNALDGSRNESKSPAPEPRKKMVFFGAVACLVVVGALAVWYGTSRRPAVIPPRAPVITEKPVSPTPAAIAAATIPGAPVVLQPPVGTPSPPAQETRPPVELLPAASAHDSELVSAVVRDYYAAVSRHDAEAAMSRISQKGYFLGAVRDKSYLKSTVKKYLRTWDKISYDLGPIYVSQTDGGFFADFDVNYVVANKSGEKKGHSRNLWCLVKEDGRLMIGYVKEVDANPPN